MPRITNSTDSVPQFTSVKMHASFLPFTVMSFGHLIDGGTGRKDCNVSARATAAIKVICGALEGVSLGRRTTEVYRFTLGGDTQRRARRPRPCVCDSAITTWPSFAPCSASRRAWVLVEPISEK